MLAAHLDARQQTILRAWHAAVNADPGLTTASTLSRTQFEDHIPDVLDDFAIRMGARRGAERRAALEEAREDGAVHGLHRWQQGYRLREVTREWGHLHLCLADELERYASAHADLEDEVMSTARRALVQLINAGVGESTAKYYSLQRTEAIGHVRDLQRTLAQWRAIDRQRAEAWREAAHDLRGSVGTVKNVSSVLGQEGVPEPQRTEFVTILQKGVTSLHEMLEDVMSLARLNAGHEQRQVKRFDASAVLNELCESTRQLARERGLSLSTEGPAALPVEGDAAKLRRIVQNLLLNALKYTESGGIVVTWGDSRNNDPQRWMLCVRDTGPGFHAGPGAPLAGALQEATREAQEVEERAELDSETSGAAETVVSPEPRTDPRPVSQETGEGIGLSIVKRLCELLDASLELESRIGEGTTFRIILPRRYDEPREQPAAEHPRE